VLKVAKKSPKRGTLTLSGEALALLDRMRGRSPKSTYVENLLKKEMGRLERSAFYEEANRAYTSKVCEETIKIHEEFPMDEA
jgi:L-fucose mutarotase/ribose pyranase (RbsD/FucU family)